MNAASMKSIGIVAMSLDGRITKHQSEGAAFTSPQDQHYFRQVLKTFDCCILGAKTFEVIKTALLNSKQTERLQIVLTRNPSQYQEYTKPNVLEFTDSPIAEVFADLRARGKQRCAILGGAWIYGECLQNNLMDELWVTLEPLIFGEGKPFVNRIVDCQLTLQSVEHLAENTLLLKYRVQ
jgi:dihydrofolate reductase